MRVRFRGQSGSPSTRTASTARESRSSVTRAPSAAFARSFFNQVRMFLVAAVRLRKGAIYQCAKANRAHCRIFLDCGRLAFPKVQAPPAAPALHTLRSPHGRGRHWRSSKFGLTSPPWCRNRCRRSVASISDSRHLNASRDIVHLRACDSSVRNCSLATAFSACTVYPVIGRGPLACRRAYNGC